MKVGFGQTDILGALLLAEQLFHERSNGWRNVLVIFSDMRQDTVALNLETTTAFYAEPALARTKRKGLSANLANVEVTVLGVDNAGRPITYWERLREFWLGYFSNAGGNVQSCFALRELPRLEP